MPGVPSGRGCSQCRAQKKKCDQLQPTCSRCNRLKLECVGSGERRYKFMSQEGIVVRPNKRNQSPHFHFLPEPPPLLGGRSTAAASSFIFILDVTDVRYDLACYGTFLKDIPKRLGTNAALDASVEAMVSAYSCLHKRQQSVEALAKYGYALNALRRCLDGEDAKSAETLCAIYFMLICQTWVGASGDLCINHGEAIAHVLNAIAEGMSVRRGWAQLSAFENKLLTTLSTIVWLESIFNPEVHLHSWLQANLTMTDGPPPGDILFSCSEPHEYTENCRSRKPGLPHNTLELANMARVTDLLRSPAANLPEVVRTYQNICCDSILMHSRLLEFEDDTVEEPNECERTTTPAHRLLPLAQTAQGVLLFLALMLNATLQNILADPSDLLALSEDAATFSSQVIHLAKACTSLRPLGASYIPLCLIAACIVTEDGPARAELEALLIDYGSDFASASWMDLVILLKDRRDASKWSILPTSAYLPDPKVEHGNLNMLQFVNVRWL